MIFFYYDCPAQDGHFEGFVSSHQSTAYQLRVNELHGNSLGHTLKQVVPFFSAGESPLEHTATATWNSRILLTSFLRMAANDHVVCCSGMFVVSVMID